MNVHSQPPVFTSFKRECLRIEIGKLLPLKLVRKSVKSTRKYQQILASIEEVGIVEPPAITPVPGNSGQFFIVDGHLRIEALKDLDQTDVDCLIAPNDDTYTYNKRTNRLSAVQDHKMIVRAMEKGVSAERLGKTLGLAPKTIEIKFRMLNGICSDAVALLADTNCPSKVFSILRLMKPVRQIEVAELMVGQKNFSAVFANAMLGATAPVHLANPSQAKEGAVSVESMAKLERELAALQLAVSSVEDSYGPDVLHLTVVKRYLANLLRSGPVVSWLARHQPDYLAEFQRITEIEDLAASSIH